MERGLVGLGVGLADLGLQPGGSETQDHYNLPTVDLFGALYDLGVDYRPDLDFQVEDIESILSEKLVDMDDDWFTPTVARHRMEDEARIKAGALSTQPHQTESSRVPTLPILRAYSDSANARAQKPEDADQPATSLGAERWGTLAEGLPFARPPGVSNDQHAG
jgi:autophagy-related protein 13